MSRNGSGLGILGEYCAAWVVLLLVLVVIGGTIGIGNEISNAISRNDINAMNARIASGTYYPARNALPSGIVNFSSDGGAEFPKGSLTFNVTVANEGDYYLAATWSKTSGGEGSLVTVSVNDRLVEKDFSVESAMDCPSYCIADLSFSRGIKIHLRAGSNTIVLSNEDVTGYDTYITNIIIAS